MLIKSFRTRNLKTNLNIFVLPSNFIWISLFFCLKFSYENKFERKFFQFLDPFGWSLKYFSNFLLNASRKKSFPSRKENCSNCLLTQTLPSDFLFWCHFQQFNNFLGSTEKFWWKNFFLISRSSKPNKHSNRSTQIFNNFSDNIADDDYRSAVIIRKKKRKLFFSN